MKKTDRYMILIVMVMVAVSLSGLSVYAEEGKKEVPISVTSGLFTEVNKTPTKEKDYTFNYNIIKYGDLTFRYDHFNNPSNYKRYWVHYGKVNVFKSNVFNMTYNPGVEFDSRHDFVYGGIVQMDFPKAGLSIQQRSYGGAKSDKHYTFTDLKVADFGYVSHYYLSRSGVKPDSYLGPKIKIGKNPGISVWFGVSTNNPGANMIDVNGSIRF